MKALLIVMALGGYNVDSPSVAMYEAPSKPACEILGAQIVKQLSSIREIGFSLDKPNRNGPRYISYICEDIVE